MEKNIKKKYYKKKNLKSKSPRVAFVFDGHTCFEFKVKPCQDVYRPSPQHTIQEHKERTICKS